MRTIGVAELKANLSRELRRVAAGDAVTVTDRMQPVAILGPVPAGLRYTRRSRGPLAVPAAAALTNASPDELLEAERGDR